LSGSALKVPVGWGGVVASYPLSSQAPTPVEVELGCDNCKLPKLIYLVCKVKYKSGKLQNIVNKLGLSCAKLRTSWG
jgi:hypothetical protein